MNTQSGENWPKSEAEALALQTELGARVIEAPLGRSISTIGGLDVAYDEARDELIAAMSRFEFPQMKFVSTVMTSGATEFPYIPGLFSFRELPPLLKLINGCDRNAWPDILICDGHGRIHPRRFGLACHLGVVLDHPVIGCAKNHLCGDWEMPGASRGNWSPVTMDGDVIGAALRTQTGVNPVFVSVGHMTTLDEAIDIVLTATPNFRLPETTRAADAAVRAALAKT